MEEENNEIPKVESVSDFLNKISEIRRERNENSTAQRDNTVLYFRGQSKNWEIKPFIARDNLLLVENEILKTAYSRCSSHFKNITNYFDLLTDFQHYGLPTRLLDLTTNPLVALYFACCDNQKEDGIVFYDVDYLHYNTEQDIQILSFLSFELANKKSVGDCLDILVKYRFYSKDYVEIIKGNNFKGLANLLNSVFLVQPNCNNERINRQSGMFLLPSLFKIINSKDEIVTNSSMIFKDNQELSHFFKQRIIINSNNKNEILDELNFYNINEASLFPEFEKQLLAIAKSYKKIYKESKIDIVDDIKESNMQLSYVKNVNSEPTIKHDKLNILSPFTVGLATGLLPIALGALPIVGACIGGAYIAKKILDKNNNESNSQLLMNKINSSLEVILSQYITKKEINQIESIKFIDWYKKESLVSQLKLELRDLLKDKINKKELKVTIDNIMQELQSKIDEQNNIIDVEPNTLS